MFDGFFNMFSSMNANNQNMMSQREQQSFDREQFNWQKEQYANQQVREDSAVQRRVADLKLAGLSPTLAAGSAASAAGAPAPHSSSAPMMQSTKSNLLAETLGIAQLAQALSKGQVDIAKTSAEKALAESKNAREILERQIRERDFGIVRQQGIRSDIGSGLAGQASQLDAFMGGAASKVRDATAPARDKIIEVVDQVNKGISEGGSAATNALKTISQKLGDLLDIPGLKLNTRNNSAEKAGTLGSQRGGAR